jgi:hypothetical protein
MVLPAREARETVQFTLRLPAALHDNLTRDAARVGTTLTALIINRLKRSSSETDVQQHLAADTRSLIEIRRKLEAARSELTELNALISALEPEHTVVRALRSAQAMLSPSSGVIRPPRRKSMTEAELVKTRDEVRDALSIVLARMSGSLDKVIITPADHDHLEPPLPTTKSSGDGSLKTNVFISGRYGHLDAVLSHLAASLPTSKDSGDGSLDNKFVIVLVDRDHVVPPLPTTKNSGEQ